MSKRWMPHNAAEILAHLFNQQQFINISTQLLVKHHTFVIICT